MVRWFFSFGLVGALVAGCGQAPEKAQTQVGSNQASGQGASTNTRVFQVKGMVISIKPREKLVEIKHEAIPDYMPAMTMPFDVKNTNILAGVEPGERVEFRLVTTDTDAWIDDIKKAAPPSASNADAPVGGPPTNGPFRMVKNVEPLQVGEPLPEYQLTNQFGQVFSTHRYLGQALAITFLFTRCPYPTYCPRMANNFGEVQNALLTMTGGPTNWQLLTVSFDPEFDKPEVLKAYAQSHQYQPDHWTFATGALIDVTALGDEVGLTFWHDESGSISHNLRTAVVNAKGRVQQIYVGNTWTSGELVAEMLKAARE